MAERAHRRTKKTIRNLTNKLVHLRLAGTQDKPYRIELAPRGAFGDWHTVPAALTDDGTFTKGVDKIFEIIPESEAKAIEYGPVGYQEQPRVQVYRPEDTTVSKTPDWDGTGRPPNQQRQSVGPATASVPGSDDELGAAYQAGSSAMPDGANTQRVVTERVGK